MRGWGIGRGRGMGFGYGNESMLKSTDVIAPTIHSDVPLQCSAMTERVVGAFFFENFFGEFFPIFTGNCVLSDSSALILRHSIRTS